MCESGVSSRSRSDEEGAGWPRGRREATALKLGMQIRFRLAAPAVSLALLLVSTGCASVHGGAQSLGTEVRPQAPPEYDVLVAQQHASEGRLPEAIAAYRRAVAKDDESAYLHRVVADALARSNQLDEAVLHARRAYELEPEDRLGRSLLAQLYRVRREPQAAMALLVDESGDPLDVDAATSLYQIHLEKGDADAALGVAEWLIENDDDPLRARIALANVYEKLDRPLDAEKVLREVLELAPGDLRIYGALARSMRQRGDRDGEIAIYREVLEANPDDHATLVALADAQMAEDDLEGAIATLSEVERRYPDDSRSVVRLGFLFYEAQRMEEAAERFEQARQAFPAEYEIAFFLGVTYRRQNQDDHALAVLSSIPTEHRHFSEARTQMAAIYEKRGDFVRAREQVELAMSVEPSRPLELYSAQLLSKSGEFEAAIDFLEELLEAEPDDDEVIYNLGVVYGEVDQNDRAIEYMRRALELNPENASALNYIGYTWAEQGQNLDEAEEMIRRAIELRPDDGYIVDSLGWVFYMRARPLVLAGRRDEAMGYLEQALAELERAVDLTGGDPVISEHLGDTYLLMDEPRRALDLFREALELGPREQEQPNLQDKLEALQREFE
jgi:tetratricopeptide (TPR) repeat protein